MNVATTPIKRAAKGLPVVATIDGQTFVGEIANANKDFIFIKPAGGGKPFQAERGAVSKIDKADLEAAVAEAKAERAASGKTIIPTAEYTYVKCRAASGKLSKDNADKIATMLRGKSLEEAYDIGADLLNESAKALKNRYSHLNLGQQRMCLGNLMRGAV